MSKKGDVIHWPDKKGDVPWCGEENIFASTDLYQHGSSCNIPDCLLDLECSRNDRRDQANCEGIQKRCISPGSWLHGHTDRTTLGRRRIEFLARLVVSGS